MAEPASPDGTPVLLDVTFELAAPRVVCVPPLEGPDGLDGLVQQWMEGLLGHGSLVRRLDVGEGALTGFACSECMGSDAW